MIHGFDIKSYRRTGELVETAEWWKTHSLGREPHDIGVSNNTGAAKRRKTLSLGREPQGLNREKMTKPRSGDRHSVVASCGSRRRSESAAPSGLDVCGAACSWGSRPRLGICRAFGARDLMPDTGQVANSNFEIRNPKSEIGFHPFPIMWYCHRSRSEKWKRGDIASRPVRPMLCSRKWSSANRPSMSGSGGTSKPA